MKRIKSACITQIIQFSTKEGPGTSFGRKRVQDEIKRYKYQLDRARTKYKILSEEKQPDGSVIIELIRECNDKPIGKYLD